MPNAVKRLFLLRHANAASARAGQRDIERPLDDAGKEEARYVAKVMLRKGWRPEILIASPALRCRQTAAAVLEGFGDEMKAKVEDALYEGSLTTYLDVIAAQPEASVMLVGHNPIIEELFWRLAGDAVARQHLRSFYPTAGLAVFDRNDAGDAWCVTAMLKPQHDA